MKKLKLYYIIITIFIFNISYSQVNTKESLTAEFTYLLKAKIYKSTPNYIHEELFSMQVLNDKSFFISEKAIEFDSVFQSEFKSSIASGETNVNFSGKSFPKTKFPYTIIQSSQNIEYFENIGTVLFTYSEPIISNWSLIDETKTINSLHCKKAEINYKGRSWEAWYTTDIPLSYGPYKFSGLPGLIVKISDKNNDFDFELVGSVSGSKLKGKVLNINERRFKKATETSETKFIESKNNFINNFISSLSSTQTSITPETMERLKENQKRKQQEFNDQNFIEIRQ